MFAIIAAILFGVALLLELLGDIDTRVVTALTLAGLLALALQLALAVPVPWRRP